MVRPIVTNQNTSNSSARQSQLESAPRGLARGAAPRRKLPQLLRPDAHLPLQAQQCVAARPPRAIQVDG